MIGLYLATGHLVNTVDNISGYPTFQVREQSYSNDVINAYPC